MTSSPDQTGTELAGDKKVIPVQIASADPIRWRFDFMRKPRLLKAGALYHVTARANRQELVMKGSAMKSLFIRTLRRARTPKGTEFAPLMLSPIQSL